ncbi:DUF4097 family beta strand repeat-containing protein [Nocardioides sp. URHA0020]|uniref:DUF4097 family beta strand repeat-containing protein n=1 Tax=Nocardioides sp. URHA0020 TaxID=1380392 RepID=UPI00048E4A60|nr:DUF4097 family beta strand repeat-containing protein [Nocardioides sp. URHA0020]
MTEQHFDTPQPIDLFVEIGRGLVAVTATDTAQTEVTITGRDADQVTVREDRGQISVVGPKQLGSFFGGDHKLDVRVTLPTDSNVVVRTGSADISLTGDVGTAKLKSGSGTVHVGAASGPLLTETGSGDIRIEQARGALKVKSGSGDIVVGSSTGVVSVSTGSGDVRLGSTGGPTVVKTGSGDLEVGESTHDLSLTTGSGDLVVNRAHRGRVTAKGASGDVRVGIPAGVPVWTDITTVSGEIRSTLTSAGQPAKGADHVEVRARTVSGDVVLAES